MASARALGTRGEPVPPLIEVLAARIALELGRLDAAEQTLDGADALLRARLPEQAHERAWALATRAELLMRRDQVRAFLPLITRDRHEHAPQLARLRAVAGLCAWHAGHAAAARELSAQAGAAFRAQPGVSGYYELPWQALETVLEKALAQRPGRA